MTAPPRSLRRNRSAANGTSRSTGNSFAAVPSPSRTPAPTSRLRRNAYVAPVARATAMRSQFMNPYKSRVGASAKYSARGPAIRHSRNAITPAAIDNRITFQ